MAYRGVLILVCIVKRECLCIHMYVVVYTYTVQVQLIIEGLRARVAEWSNPPILNLYINSFKLRLDHSGSQPFN